MHKRIPLFLLLVIQALGTGAITLAHARDVVAAPPGIEAGHDERCAILHDEVRCALSQYAGARIVIQPAFKIPAPAETIRFTLAHAVCAVAAAERLPTPARAPPTALS